MSNLRPAATVILVRQHQGELQVYLVKRSAANRFFPETYVFPGGEMDREDGDMSLWLSCLDMDREEISRHLGGGIREQEAIAYGVTAIRETFEEAGVLLCSCSNPRGQELAELRSRRMEQGLSRGWLEDLVVSTDCRLGFSRLMRWAHWITPEALPRRYDTRFLLAFMPQGQECIPDLRETTDGLWVSPHKALAGNFKAQIPLSPPTLITLHQLLDYEDLDALRAETETRVWGDALLPHMITLSHGAVILEPWDPLYGEEAQVDEGGLEEAILPPGEPFSRIWYHEGIWRPVRS